MILVFKKFLYFLKNKTKEKSLHLLKKPLDLSCIASGSRSEKLSFCCAIPMPTCKAQRRLVERPGMTNHYKFSGGSCTLHTYTRDMRTVPGII